MNTVPSVISSRSSFTKLTYIGSLLFVMFSSCTEEPIYRGKTTEEVVITPPKKDTVDISHCTNYDQIIDTLANHGCIVTIDPSAEYQKDSLFFQQTGISEEVFIDAYNNSEIVRHGVYDQYLYHRSRKSLKKNHMSALNNRLIDRYSYKRYVHISHDVYLKEFGTVMSELIAQESQPPRKYPPYYGKDIPIDSDYLSSDKYPRREAKKLLDDYCVALVSSNQGRKELGNNLSSGRTCLHGIRKDVVDFLIALSGELDSLYGKIPRETYNVLTINGGTERGDHGGNKDVSVPHSHTGGDKVDLSLKGRSGILLGIYFYQHGIRRFQTKDEKRNPIELNIAGYMVKIAAHAAHFDVEVLGKATQ